MLHRSSATGGTAGVGRSTIKVIVVSSGLLLVANFYISRDVFLSFSGRKILSGISMQIPDGRITAILGPSGSGKSTIIRLMLGLIQPTYGNVLVDGVDISRFSEKGLFPIRKTMGIVFQGNALFDSLSVQKQILDLIKQLKQDKRLDAVMVTHVISDVTSVADTVLVLYQGKVIFHDTPEKMQECDHPFVQSFLADPEQL